MYLHFSINCLFTVNYFLKCCNVLLNLEQQGLSIPIIQIEFLFAVKVHPKIMATFIGYKYIPSSLSIVIYMKEVRSLMQVPLYFLKC